MPAGGGDHLQTGALEQAGQNAPAHRAVVDDERGGVLSWRQPRIERRPVMLRRVTGRGIIDRGHQRQLEKEPAAVPRHALDLQLGTHAAEQVLADRQTESRAAGGSAGLRFA